MNQVAEKPSLYSQLTSLPSNLIGEVVGGRLHTQPRPAPPHALAASALGGELVLPYQKGKGGPGGWWILDEPEIHFIRRTEVLVPDLAGWQRQRMPVLPQTAYFELPPDWVCEILSPSSLVYDREEKMPIYARYGVPYAWLLDPLARTLETFELQQGTWVAMAGFQEDDTVSAAPFQEITIPLVDLWAYWPMARP